MLLDKTLLQLIFFRSRPNSTERLSADPSLIPSTAVSSTSRTTSSGTESVSLGAPSEPELPPVEGDHLEKPKTGYSRKRLQEIGPRIDYGHGKHIPPPPRPVPSKPEVFDKPKVSSRRKIPRAVRSPPKVPPLRLPYAKDPRQPDINWRERYQKRMEKEKKRKEKATVKNEEEEFPPKFVPEVIEANVVTQPQDVLVGAD